MKKILLSILSLLVAVAVCGQQPPAPRKAYIYCAIDTASCSLPLYQKSYTLFPDSKFNPRPKHTAAKYENGVAIIEIELDKLTPVSVMPSRDTSVKISWSGSLTLLPGDSLELTNKPDTMIPKFKAIRPVLIEPARKDNTCNGLLDERFSFRNMPRVVGKDLARYRASWDSLKTLKIALLDSCRKVMPISDDYYQYKLTLIDEEMFNSLCTATLKNADVERPAGYFDGLQIPESESYALRNKYIKCAVPDAENNFDAVYAGILKAPENLRDYLTAIAIGYYAELQLPDYEQSLTKVIADAQKSIRDTAYLSYIARAKEYYFKRNMPFSDDALQQTMLRTTDSDTKMSLADVLKQFEGRPVYIDFWASWCSGCILDMQRSANAKKYLADKGIVYLYFSIDEDVEAWLKACEKYEVMKDSYLCFEERNSPMTKFLGIREIPRYILLDEKHKIVSMDAPRPTDYSLDELKRLVESMGPITIIISK